MEHFESSDSSEVIEVRLSIKGDFAGNSKQILEEISSDIWRTIMSRYPEIADCQCVVKQPTKGVTHEDNQDY